MPTSDLQFSDVYDQLARIREELNRQQLGSPFRTPTPVPTTPPPQASNQLRNGSYAHSSGSWDNVSTADDRRYECAHWYAHPTTANQAMQTWGTSSTGAKTFTDANVTAASDQIAIATHGYETSDAIKLTTTGTLPAGLATGTVYYVIKVDANTIKLASSVANSLAGTAVDITGASGGGTHTVTPVNYRLKSDDHAQYLSTESNWTRQDAPAGCARLNAGSSLDAPLVQPTGEPGYTMYAVFNVAKGSQYIYAPEDARISCGLYARQNGQWDYLYGVFTISGAASGTVATPTSRDYVVHARTSRGFTVQSSVTTVASAPSDTDFSNGARVVLSWDPPLNYGVLGYDVYRNTGGTYLLLARVETGLTSYIDNNGYLETAAGYPTADYTRLTAITATLNSVVSNLAVDGIDDTWDTLPFAIRIPANYNHSLTDFNRSQWVRWKIEGLTSGGFDVRVTDGVNNATTNITSASGQFTPGMVGKTLRIAVRGSWYTVTITGVPDPNTLSISFFDIIGTSGTDCEMIIEGGADSNLLYLDLAHLSFGANAIFSFHPDDLSPSRGVPPVAANGSTQGGSGNGGGTIDTDGGPICPWEDEQITITDGAGSIFKKRVGDLKRGEYAVYGNKIGQITGLSYHVADIYKWETENGFVCHTSDSHKFLTSLTDTQGKRNLAIGDDILTQINGKDVVTKLKSKQLIEKNGIVVKIKMAHHHFYLIGEGEGKWGGVCSHNRKLDDSIIVT